MDAGQPFKLADDKGLFLLVNPNGSKYFRLKYRFDGKEKMLALGVYPETSLKQARDKRSDAREKLTAGIDPWAIIKDKKLAKQITSENQNRLDAGQPILKSFEHITLEWLNSAAHLVTDITHKKKIRRFEKYVFPLIGGIAIDKVNSPHIHSLIKPIVAKNTLETAYRVRGEIACVFSYAIAHGLAIRDPYAPNLQRKCLAESIQPR
ncbi:MAG: Arm DNA-binding domain-containing protein [Methylococcaceae bacterium]|nr:Arm DNA-binding domain-containing protein [Methylococcaceae bacterium]